MSNLLDITGDDIARLGDVELRALIGLLCEADYRLAGLPTKGITWGGHQDARDGGLDVAVRDEISPPSNSFVPRNVTGFQIKKNDMPRSEILKEMRPNGVLREEIKALIQTHGAYIIVSSTGSTTDTALKNRLEAMKDAVADEENHQNLHLDFLDRGRVATWVRSHRSLILWVRNKIGRSLIGWRPYENWANAPGWIEEEYLLDDGLRLHDGTKTTGEGLSVEAGLLKLRSALSSPGISVRLAGLSGVGKTRLVQALFDQRVGEHALNPSQSFYTDISDAPVPDPGTLANQLISDKTRAVLIVDNCPPDLHNRLTQTCSRPESTVSLLTVEYDVRDDVPEETSVFRLEPASEDIIETLIRKRFSHISQVDARTIAGFSGGNARVAIALANTVQHGETLSGFRNEELFKRLFWQRHDPSESLLLSAQACSLVYSFEGTDTSSEKSELQFLASLVNKSSADLYRDVAELKKRDLIQSRSVWRAVLPHAIANRLATRALESIPKNTLVGKFLSGGSDRLVRSFARRLSFLHDSKTAVEIVNDWLGQDGWIGESIHNLNSLGIDVLRNIAPVAPEKTLEAIERAANGPEGASFASRENSHHIEFVRLLRHLAYDPALFDKSVELMCLYALSESKDENNNSTRDVLKSLFYIYLSGTHATVDARARIIEELVDSENPNKQELGLLFLDAALETWHFSSSHQFGFGARPRDFGYEPKTQKEIAHWFDTFIGIVTRLALSGQPIAEKARKLLANNLRGLWTNAGMFDELEESARQIQAQKPWNDGWIAVREILRYDRKGFNEEVQERLRRLEKLLKPVDLLEQARTFALSDQHRSFDLADDFDDTEDASAGWRRAEETTRKIGAQVAQSPDTLKALLPDLVSMHGPRLNTFGRGLADGCTDKLEMFKILRAEIEKTSQEKRQINVFLGFLSVSAESDPAFYNSTLDSLVSDDVLGQWFPTFQTTSSINQRGVERLHEALDLGKAQIYTFRYLAWGRAHESINDDELAGLLKKILSKEEDLGVTIEILQMRFHGRNDKSPKVSNSLIAVAQDVLLTYAFDEKLRSQGNRDDDLAEIARISLSGKEGIPAARQVAQKLANAIMEQRVYAFDYPRLLDSLAQAQPIVFLDVFMGDNSVDDNQRSRMFSYDVVRRGNPLNQIPDGELLCWCEKDPAVRYPMIASAIQAFTKSGETGKLEWKPVVYAIFERAPDLDAILEHLADATRPRSWSGSLADILLSRTVLFQDLYEHDNAKIRAWAKAQYSDLQESIRKQREWEEQHRRERDERFE
jgi:hypothetical protein